MRIILLSIATVFFFVTSVAQVNDHARVEGQILVMLKGKANPDIDPSLRSQIESLGLNVGEKLTKTTNIWMLSFDEQLVSPDKVLQALRKHPAVEIAQYNHKVEERENIPNDPSFNLLWQLKNTGQSGGYAGSDIHATYAWDITTNGVTALGDTIVIAVVDGGADLTHEDLNFKKNYNEIPNNGIDDDNNGYVDDYNGWNAYSSTGNMVPHDHGTHVIGIAAAKTNNGVGVSGVSYGAKVLPVAGSSTTEATVVRAYDYVYTMRKIYNESNGQFGAYIVASNSSFGVDQGDPSNFPLWGAMYDSMGMVGIVNVGSTANRAYDVDIQGDIPTAMTNESLVAVTNTTNQDMLNSQAAWGLNSIDLGAPGTSIYSTRQGNIYGYKTGTSMASPVVSGSVALMYAATDSTRLLEYKQFPSLAVSRFKRYLIATVDTIPALTGKSVSSGRINLLDAVTMAANPPQIFADSSSIYVGLKPNTADTVLVQLTTSATEPNSFILSLPPDSTWVSTDITQGLMFPGMTQYFSVILNAEGKAEGTYTVSLSVNDYFLNQLVIPITMLVDHRIAVKNISTNVSAMVSPNPFTDMQKIHINLLRTSDVSVRVVNMYGVTVADVYKGKLVPGMHTLAWDGRNAKNQIVGTGVYFIVVTDQYGSVTMKTIKK